MNSIALDYLEVGVHANSFDGSLVGTNGSIRAETPEETLADGGRHGVDGLSVVQGGVCHVVLNTWKYNIIGYQLHHQRYFNREGQDQVPDLCIIA